MDQTFFQVSKLSLYTGILYEFVFHMNLSHLSIIACRRNLTTFFFLMTFFRIIMDIIFYGVAVYGL